MIIVFYFSVSQVRVNLRNQSQRRNHKLWMMLQVELLPGNVTVNTTLSTLVLVVSVFVYLQLTQFLTFASVHQHWMDNGLEIKQLRYNGSADFQL